MELNSAEYTSDEIIPMQSLCLFTHSVKKATSTAALLNYADNFFLPFALLACRTFLPPGVLILALNP